MGSIVAGNFAARHSRRIEIENYAREPPVRTLLASVAERVMRPYGWSSDLRGERTSGPIAGDAE